MKALSFNDVSAKTSLKRTAIYSLIATGNFPKQVKVGRRSVWIEAEIDRWLGDRVAARDQLKAA